MAAALLTVAGALLTTACSSDDDEAAVNNEPQTVTFTATLAPKGDDATTRAITTGKDANNKEILNVAWTENEQIAVRYQTTDNVKQHITTANVTAVDPTTGTATISAALTNPRDGGTVEFVYPATLASNSPIGDFFDERKLLNQHGNLTGANGISMLYDAATGSGTISVSAGTAVVSSKVTMNNRVCICKFRFTLDKGGEMVQQAFNDLKIYDGNGHVYTIISDKDDGTGGTRRFTNTDDIYVAMLPVSGKTVNFYYKQTVSGGYKGYDYYYKSSASTTLTAGKFYRSLNLTLTRDNVNGVYSSFKDLSAGNVTAEDGDIIYQSSSAATANTITIPDGCNVTIYGVNISATGSTGIICSGTANIKLVGTNSVTATTKFYPGIQAGGSGKTLTIQGNGSLYARGAQCAAGIGSENWGTCGNIIISGGSITARGGMYAAGIGSGNRGKYESITITEGITSVTAIGCTAPGEPSSMPDPIGKGKDDQGSGSVTIDGTTTWTAGTATTHLNWDVESNFVDDANNRATRWTLTHK